MSMYTQVRACMRVCVFHYVLSMCMWRSACGVALQETDTLIWGQGLSLGPRAYQYGCWAGQ